MFSPTGSAFSHNSIHSSSLKSAANGITSVFLVWLVAVIISAIQAWYTRIWSRNECHFWYTVRKANCDGGTTLTFKWIFCWPTISKLKHWIPFLYLNKEDKERTSGKLLNNFCIYEEIIVYSQNTINVYSLISHE